MIKLKNYIVVKQFVDLSEEEGFEIEPYRLGIVGDCFKTYEEARAYAQKISQKSKLTSSGEIFYNDSEEQNTKKFLVVQEIDVVICKVDTTTGSFSVEMSNFKDSRLGVTIDERSIMNYLSKNRYVKVEDINNKSDIILNTRQITAIHL